MASFLDTDIKYLKGVGDARAKILKSSLEVATFRDLLYYFPFRHADRSRFYSIGELSGTDLPEVQIRGRFLRFTEEGEGARKRLTGIFTDGKKMMETVWFSKISYFSSLYKPGVEYVIFGKPSLFRNVYSIAHPEVEVYDPAKPPTGFRGIYSLPETARKKGLSIKTIQTLVKEIIANPRFPSIPETLPPSIVSALHLMPLTESLRQMHFPESANLLQKARERLKFEELFYIETHILRFSMERSSKMAGYVFSRIGANFNKFYNEIIPFPLTGAQKRVLKEIWADMKTGRQMNRLLQGDVGSGKTLVAFMALLMGVDNGMQGALMAPTEILATQHYETISSWASPLGLNVALLTGSTRVAERRRIHEGLENGHIHIIIGTHALLEDKVKFKNLAVAVIDEQHRFGVAQRAKIWRKNALAPHVLVMTATPIPRTLAMTVYGDLDVSVIDELPPGRKPVTTMLRYADNRMEVDRLLFTELRKGRQVYIVYPLIKENEKLDLKSLEEGYERTMETFADYKVCMVHGQMTPEQKNRQMEQFVSGEARIMVATTVIEVGVNVPNATVMVIENADRFGLSQLHQLRGRVGRGAERSYCVLMGKHTSGATTKKRLSIMTETNDGFLISEADMKIRGPGDMEGTQQSGLPFSLKVADLARDGQILSKAREIALSMLRGTPSLCMGSAQGFANEASHMPVISLSPAETLIVSNELNFRFNHTVDWSLIS